MSIIAVTGATGKLGRATLQFLLAGGVPAETVRPIVRDLAKAHDLVDRKFDVAYGNYADAAQGAGVKHIIYTSVIKPAADALFAASPGHFHTEALIRASGIAYTFFRNNLYLDIVPFLFAGALASGTLTHSGGTGRIGFVAREDIAEALAAVLTSEGHVNREYPMAVAKSVALGEAVRAGEFDLSRPGLEQLLRRAPLDLRNFLAQTLKP